MKLAERSRTWPLLAAATATTAGLLVVAGSEPAEPVEQLVVKEFHGCVLPKPPPPPPESCPTGVRAQLKLDRGDTVVCVHGTFGADRAPGYFVIGYYRTSEAWERLAVVADDGRLLVPLTDRPSHRAGQDAVAIEYGTADLDGNGIDELVEEYTVFGDGGDTYRLEVTSLRGTELSFGLGPTHGGMWSWSRVCELGMDGRLLAQAGERDCNGGYAEVYVRTDGRLIRAQ